MPGMRGWIKRPRAIVLKGYGEDGEQKERQFEVFFLSLDPFLPYVRARSSHISPFNSFLGDQFYANARKTQDANTQKAPCFQTPHPCFLSICDTQKARTPVFKHRTPAFSPCVSE